MAHNAYIRALGVWNATSVALSSELATLDLRQFQAVNGDLGGVWAPSSAITVGGSGLAVTGLLDADDADITIGHGRFLTVLGTAGGALGTVNVNLGAVVNLLNGSTTNLAGLLNMTAAGTIITDAGSTITVSGALTLTNNAALTMGGTSTFLMQTTTTFNSTSTFNANGTTAFGSTAVVTSHASSTMTLAGAITTTGVVTLNGTTNIDGTATVVSGTTLAFAAGSAMSAAATAPFALANIVTCSNQVEFASGCVATVQSGGQWVTQSGATITRGAAETVTGKVTQSGTGAYRIWRHLVGSAADHTYDGREYDLIEVPGIAGATVWTFSDLAAGDRVFIHINRWEYSNANQIQLQRGDGSPILTFPTLVSGGSTIFWNGTRWIAHIVTASVTVP